MTMRERIAAGRLFTDYCEGLPEDRLRAKRRMMAFNATGPDAREERARLLNEIFGKETKAWIEPPFYFCYGTNIELGEESYINFNCNFVDDGKIIIGKKVMFAPAVTIATVGHPINPQYRGYMYTVPVRIGDNCWIGAGSIICPGVTIGENSVIGAGSVVTKDVPANSVAVGNPCRVLRAINEHAMKYYYKDREITQADLDEEARLAAPDGHDVGS
jgi:maltose O-acetyltransferase